MEYNSITKWRIIETQKLQLEQDVHLYPVYLPNQVLDCLSIDLRNIHSKNEKIFKQITRFIQSSLQNHLFLQLQHCGDILFTDLSDAIAHSSSFKQITLDFCFSDSFSTPEAVGSLLKSILSNPDLIHLKLQFRYCAKFTNDSLAIIAEQLLLNDHALEILDLQFEYCENLADQGIAYLVDWFENNTTVQQLLLNLTGTAITDNSLASVTQAVCKRAKNNVIQLKSFTLNIEACSMISEVGITYLQKIFRETSVLSFNLSIGSNEKLTSRHLKRFFIPVQVKGAETNENSMFERSQVYVSLSNLPQINQKVINYAQKLSESNFLSQLTLKLKQCNEINFIQIQNELIKQQNSFSNSETSSLIHQTEFILDIIQSQQLNNETHKYPFISTTLNYQQKSSKQENLTKTNSNLDQTIVFISLYDKGNSQILIREIVCFQRGEEKQNSSQFKIGDGLIEATIQVNIKSDISSLFIINSDLCKFGQSLQKLTVHLSNVEQSTNDKVDKNSVQVNMKDFLQSLKQFINLSQVSLSLESQIITSNTNLDHIGTCISANKNVIDWKFVIKNCTCLSDEGISIFINQIEANSKKAIIIELMKCTIMTVQSMKTISQLLKKENIHCSVKIANALLFTDEDLNLIQNQIENEFIFSSPLSSGLQITLVLCPKLSIKGIAQFNQSLKQIQSKTKK